MLFREILIVLTIFSAIIAAGSIFISDMGTNYNVNLANESFNETFNKMSEMQEFTYDMNETIANAEPSVIGGVDIIWKGIWGMIKTIFYALSTIVSIVYNLAAEIGLPGWFVSTVLIIIITVIFFLVVSILWKRNV